jgi:hypothetical protein
VRDIETDAMVHDAMIQDVDVMSREGGGGVRRGRATEQDRIAAMEHLRPGAGGTLRVDTADDDARQVSSFSLARALSRSMCVCVCVCVSCVYMLSAW